MMVGTSTKTMQNDNTVHPQIGQRVEIKGCYGTVLYIGEVPPTKGTWLGIDWDDCRRGKHDGTHNGQSYFRTRHKTSGSFVRVEKVNFGSDFVTTMRIRYGEVKDDETAGVDKDHMAIVQREMKAALFEVVGFDKVNKRQSQFENLEVVSLKGHLVNNAGPPGELKRICPKIRELDLSKNLFNSWEVVAQVTGQLHELEFLNVSENQLRIPEDPLQFKDCFYALEHVVAGKMEYMWSDIVTCCSMMPSLKILQVPFNCIKNIEMPLGDTLANVKMLDLEGNPIGDWREINKLGKLRSLETLNVSGVGITNIHFPTDPASCKTATFPSLKLLFMSNNGIGEWESFCELDKLQKLEQVRCRDNPLFQTENTETGRQLVIARIENLKKLNGVPILSEERKGAEYDYLKKHGQEWLDMGKREDKELCLRTFVALHPRYPALVKKYGAPEEGEVKIASKTLKTKLINVEIVTSHVPGKVIKKKLPVNMSVQKLQNLIQRLFNTGNHEMQLTYRSTKHSNIEIPMDNHLKEIGYYSIEDGDQIWAEW